jgi:hypothetical protein
VLSEDALRRIGNLDREQIEHRVRLIFDKWALGDVDAVVEYLAPDVAFPSNGFWTGLAAPVHGRKEVSGLLRKS